MVEQAAGDEEQVAHHKIDLLYLVGTPIFMGKIATYVVLIYLRYFDDLDRIHEYNQGVAGLVYPTPN